MQDINQFADNLGPFKVIHVYEPSVNLKAILVVDLPRELGGIPLDEIGATAWGLSHAVDVALEHCDFELKGARFVVQGFGAVGRHVSRFLADKDAILVAVFGVPDELYGEEVMAWIQLHAGENCRNSECVK